LSVKIGPQWSKGPFFPVPDIADRTHLPDMDGYEATRLIKQQKPDSEDKMKFLFKH